MINILYNSIYLSVIFMFLIFLCPVFIFFLFLVSLLLSSTSSLSFLASFFSYCLPSFLPFFTSSILCFLSEKIFSFLSIFLLCETHYCILTFIQLKSITLQRFLLSSYICMKTFLFYFLFDKKYEGNKWIRESR